MANEDPDGSAQQNYKLYLDERRQLIDAARESARTFDKAVLTFGSVVFGFSIAFLKDIAPKPLPRTLGWLGASWTLFSLGLLAILLSFLFSHRACLFQIDSLGDRPTKPASEKDPPAKSNPWGIATDLCNYSRVVFLFLGLLCWSVFAFANLSHGDAEMNKVDTPTEKKGYVPPPPAKAPQQQTPAPKKS